MNIESQNLWEKICEHDDLATFETLHTTYYAPLCNFVFSYLKDRESCEEVISDVFVAVWQKRQELRNIRNIQSYLYTCSKNLSIDLIRKNAIRIEPDNNCYEIEIPGTRAKMNEAIEQLPQQCKMQFKMLVNDQLA